MSPLVLLLIGVILLVVLVLGLFFTRKYTPYTPTTPTEAEFKARDLPASPWQTISKEKCGLYTVPPLGPYTPGFGSVALLKGGASLVRQDESCADVDQFLAGKVVHKCLDGKNLELRTSGECRGDNGATYQPGQTEEFWAECQAELCKGGLGLVALHPGYILGNIFDSAKCVATPTIYDAKSPIHLEAEECRLDLLDSLGHSRTLFRVQRAIYANGAFVSSSQGNFVRFYHRPTGLCVAPTLLNKNLSSPVIGEGLTLISPSQTLSVDGKLHDFNGYWWYLLPAFKSGTSSFETKQGFAYLPDPVGIGKIRTPSQLISYISARPPASPVGVISIYGGTLTLRSLKYQPEPGPPFISEKPLSEGQFYDYATLPLLLNTDPAKLAFSL